MFGSGSNSDSDKESKFPIDRSDDSLASAWDDVASQIQEARLWSQSAFDRVNGFVNTSLSNGAQVEEQANRVLASLGLPKGVLGAIGSKDIAYPVPSVKQYDSCLERNGNPVWTEDGLWRCLYKGSAAERGLGPDIKQFKDYSGFLSYQRSLLAKQKEPKETKVQSPLWIQEDNETNAPRFPGSTQPKLISVDEANSKKLSPVSVNVRSETVTLDDGSLETRREVVKRYSDNTATVETTKSTIPETAKPSGWFWK